MLYCLILSASQTCQHFQQMFQLQSVHPFLDDTKEMESQYDLKDPPLIAKDTNYSLYGPFGLISLLQQLHGSYIAD